MPEPTGKAVFLSYASQDAEAVLRIAMALRAAGVEVWFDKDELVGGDAWDQKIRRQIKECALFVPVISAATQARTEGYFRLEWRLADQRTHLMAKGRPFLLPVVIDETRDAEAQVPDSFTEVQWTRLSGGETPEKFCARVKKLLGGAGASVSDLRSEWDQTINAVRRPRQPRRQAGRAWLVLATFGLAAIVALAIWQPWAKGGITPSAPSAARELVQRARGLWSGERTREKLEAASELCEQALKIDATDAEVVAAAAQVDAFTFYGGFDISEERRQRAQRRAAQARALSANSAEARHAQAVVFGFVIRSPEMLAEAERIYRGLLESHPDDRVLLYELGKVLVHGGRHDEAAAVFLRAGDRVAAGSAFFYADKFEQARAIADEALAEKRTVAGLLLKARVELYGFEDLPAAKAALARVTPAEALDDSAASMIGELQLLARESEQMLRTLTAFSSAFISLAEINYPRQYLTGFAHEMRGRHDAALVEWRGALSALNERLKTRPNDPESLGWLATLHALVGNSAEAKRTLGLFESYQNYGPEIFNFFKAFTLLFDGNKDEPLAMLADYFKRKPLGWRYAHMFARYSVEFDRVRSDPRFDALLRDNLPPGAKPFESPAKIDTKSVAVLAFANVSSDPENEYFSDGIADELLTVLQKIPGLRVAARTSAFSFKGKNPTVQEVGEKLGMAHVVDGSVRKSGKSVVITARLSRAATNEEMWSESFGPLELTDVFATQSEIAQKILTKLRGQLTGETATAVSSTAASAQAEIKAQVLAATKGGTNNPEAHQLYLQGRFLATRSGSGDVARGIDYYEQALKLDPNFTLAWSALARARLWQLSWEPLNPERAQQARIAATRALDLNADLADAHSVLSQIQLRYAYEWRAARAASAKALALAPTDAAVITDAVATEQALGSLERSIELARSAVALDPVSVDTRFYLAMSYLFIGQLTEAEAETRRIIELSSNGIFSYGLLSSILLIQGRHAEAFAAAQKEPEKMYRLQTLSAAHFALGQIRESDAALEAMMRDYKEVGPYPIAWVYTRRNDRDKAFEWLERAYQLHDAGISWVRGDTLLKPLHSDPRWPAFLKKIGLSDEQLK